ncbi:MAG: L,D-transpeptidase family protein [Anaerolineae bacterium]|nr:L,D-transpeptidase family protein [Anaerolineae bacterium]
MKRLILSLLLTFSLGISTLVDVQPTSATELYNVASQTSQAGYHVVLPGENLFRISLRYGVSVQSLITANNIQGNLVYIGQRLTIPSDNSPLLPTPAQPQPTTEAQVTPTAQPANPAQPAASNKAIHVSLNRQRVYLYENGQLVRTYLASTGMRGATKVGNFQVQSKIPEAYGSTWQLRMPYWLGIYYVGNIENGFHALPINRFGQTMWAGLLGRPASYGCVVLGTADAAALYRWATIGTSVSIRW